FQTPAAGSGPSTRKPRPRGRKKRTASVSPYFPGNWSGDKDTKRIQEVRPAQGGVQEVYSRRGEGFSNRPASRVHLIPSTVGQAERAESPSPEERRVNRHQTISSAVR